MSSSRGDSKTASQFVSLTMRLKDKLHPQRVRRSERIKHTPSQRVKPPDLDLQHKDGGVLADQQRAVISSLQYFKALVDRLGVDRQEVDKLVQDQCVVGRLLGGASGGVLEAVQTLVQLEPHLHNSKTVSSCLTRLYSSLAELIRWADQVMLQGVASSNKESTASVTTMIRAVLDGVKELVRLAAERKDGSTPSSPFQSQPAVGQTGGSGVQQTSDRKSTCQSPGAPAEDKEEEGTVDAPPKPPMPFTELLPQVSPPQVSLNRVSLPQMSLDQVYPPQVSLNRVSLPQMSFDQVSPPQVSLNRASLPQVSPPQGLSPPALPPKKRQSSSGPAYCRVAVVAPMRREPEVDTQEDECLKRFSSSSAAEDTHCEDDPDYDFLHTDLSSSETLPPLLQPSSPPPALPEKTRAAGTNSQAQTSFGFDPAAHKESPAHCDDVIGPDESLSSPLSPSKTPPPLPEKKRHIHQYLQVCSSYSAQAAAMFYPRPLTLSERYNSRQREVETTYQLSHTHLDTQTLDSTPSPELLPAPVLPPKKRQQDSAGPYEEDQTRDSVQQETEHGRRSSKELEEQEEVLLIDQQKVLRRITLKTQEEDGPDVKAASPEILLVYATETDKSTEHVLYREAFLSTYRSFISPNNVISKLQYRYRHLCDRHEPAHLTAAKNTFHLLVRVVDELCAIELDSDLLLLLMELVFSLLIGGELGLARLLRSNILSKMEQKWQLIGSPQSLRPLAARGVAARPGTLLDFRSQDLAEQLTLLDSELFCKIGLPEVLLWSKEQNEEKSPNLTEFTQHFNNVSFWVRSVVILQDKPQDREKLLLKFLKIMKHLRKLNNFNSYLSILSALDSAPLRRLDWQRSTAEALEEFSSLIDSSSSFRAYRAALAEVEPPCIPYLGLILQDLTFVHLGNPEMLMTSEGSKVNFSKRWQQFNILDTLRSYQQVPYALQPNDDIISFFNDFNDHLAEEALWDLSLRIRPRNAPRANQR
ncbi:rap guanine nucleotide exchange factor 1-like isoform X2 [Epinephelus fuscoguttatus]|uniref:rap guanine nucleotide exchange factor 1-like isoform X2 n=1 Tax=Epinephelus fuscoguttatus TaxID=293821 RepID=UPI0020D0FE9B|nr:rap guanine nucleotide exchange factor 1-like isoform X2 [Epinephelus fuscoguttatus]